MIESIHPYQELHEMYADITKERFRAFDISSYAQMRNDLVDSHIPYNSTDEVDELIVQTIATPTSFQNFRDDMANYIDTYNLGDKLGTKSLVWGVDHTQFTDVPVTAEAWGRIMPDYRHKTLMSVSKNIALLELDLTMVVPEDEKPRRVIHELAKIAGIAQSTPRLASNASKLLVAQRKIDNQLYGNLIAGHLETPGNVLVESLLGRHSHVSEDTIEMYEPNRQTFNQIKKAGALLLPLVVYCQTFDKDGNIQPAELKSQFFPPMEIDRIAQNVEQVTDNFSEALAGITGKQVNVISWQQQKAERLVKQTKQRSTSFMERE